MTIPSSTISMDAISKGEHVLLTGGTGSLGHELTARLTESGAKIRIFARDEKKQYDMKKLFPNCEYLVGDVRDPRAIRDAVRDVDVIIHGAALKYINVSELQPYEYVETNIGGTMNLLDAVLEEKNVRHCLGISTDKACLPVNTYGLTKAILEKLFLEACRRQGNQGNTVFNVARYGNVVGTRGSVIPFWKECRAKGEPLPITNPHMTRFFFTLKEATDLLNYALKGSPGLIYSKRMRACTLGELAYAMKGPEGTMIVGERPGEKKHEMLLSDDEMSRTTEDGDIFIFNPAAQPFNKFEAFGSEHAEPLEQVELRELVNEHGN